MKTFSDKLPEIVESYIIANEVCPKQRERYRAHVRRYCDWHRQRTAAPERESDSERLNGWLASLADEFAPATVNSHRQSILALIRFATPDGVPLPRADRVRRQREPEKIKRAFAIDHIRQMVMAAPRYRPMSARVYGRGAVCRMVPRNRPDGVPWSVWWEAFVLIAYHSGQYFSDLRRIKWSEVGRLGVVSIVRHKTGRIISFRLPDRALKAAKALRKLTRSELLLPWDYDTRAYFPREFGKFIRFARVPSLGAKSLRRSAITYTYMEQGEGAARQLAGHASFATTAKHYIDWSLARKPIVEPPSLGLDFDTRRRIRGLIPMASPEQDQQDALEFARYKGGRITARGLTDLSKRFRPTATAEAALDALVKAGFGSWHTEPASGRHRREFVLNPKALQSTNTAV